MHANKMAHLIFYANRKSIGTPRFLKRQQIIEFVIFVFEMLPVHNLSDHRVCIESRVLHLGLFCNYYY